MLKFERDQEGEEYIEEKYNYSNCNCKLCEQILKTYENIVSLPSFHT